MKIQMKKKQEWGAISNCIESVIGHFSTPSWYAPFCQPSELKDQKRQSSIFFGPTLEGSGPIGSVTFYDENFGLFDSIISMTFALV